MYSSLYYNYKELIQKMGWEYVAIFKVAIPFAVMFLPIQIIISYFSDRTNTNISIAFLAILIILPKLASLIEFIAMPIYWYLSIAYTLFGNPILIIVFALSFIFIAMKLLALSFEIKLSRHRKKKKNAIKKQKNNMS